MSIIWLCVAVYTLLFTLIYYSAMKPALSKPANNYSAIITISVVLFLGFAFRIFVATSITGHYTDVGCFKGWAELAFNGGLSNFYFTDAFTDYPPGYMYILYIIGAIKSLFNIDYYSVLYNVIIKLPAIICDIITGYFLYKFLIKRTNTTYALCLPILYLLNPAVMINSAAWGQVDSIFTLFVALFIFYICEKKLLKACIFFTIGFLIKPQTAIFAPILLLYVYRILFVDATQKDERKKTLGEILITAGICIVLFFVLITPFAKNFDYLSIIKQYISTITSYPYASVNAYNVFGLFGGSWRDINQPFLLLPYSVWSNIAIVSTFVVVAFIYIKRKGETNLFLLGTFIIAAIFTLAAKMHERYIFPAIILLLFAFAYKKDIRILLSFAFLSIGQFLNTGAVLCADIATPASSPTGAIIPIVCIINILSFIYLTCVMISERETIVTLKINAEKKLFKSNKPQKEFSLMSSAPKMHITRTDVIIMSIVTLIYAIVAFVNLGDASAPVTRWNTSTHGNGVHVSFEPNTYIQKIKLFTGLEEERNIKFRLTTPEGIVAEKVNSLGSVFAWHEYTIDTIASSIDLESVSKNTSIHELAFVGNDGELIKPASIAPIGDDCGINNLMDEQYTVPELISFKNSTYFDEIYHARTAYEHVHSMTPYENTHPPLGKLLIALGTLVFGMNPFGWRVVGTLLGVFMLPCIYLFAKKMFKSTPAAFAAIVLFSSDFMHFAQTRIATIDVYIVFFIILMYYFMYDYTTKSFYDTPFKKTLIPLGLSGLCMGLGIASKWTGVYAGIGLAIMFFISFGRRIYEYKKVMSNPRSTKAERKTVASCKKYCTHTILWCLVFFVIIPLIIYTLSYIPYLRAPGMKGIKSIIENQFSMFRYHSLLKDTHPFSSHWYQWPVITRPIWYFTTNVTNTTRMSIASFGNPFVWWAGLFALLYCVYKIFKDKSYTALFLVVGYLSQYVPWMGINRVVFIYHYFTCVPFIILMLSYVISDVLKRYPYRGLTLKNNTASIIILCYLLVCILAFISFYPVLSGMEVSNTYINSLKWYQSWLF